MRTVRLFAAAAIAAVVFLAVPGANRAQAAPPAIAVNSPAADQTLNGAVTMAGTISQSGNQATITQATVTIASADGFSSETKSVSLGSSAFSGGGANVSFNWSVTPKYNGVYNVTVSATGQYNGGLSGTQTQSSQVTRPFRVEIDPKKPTGIAAGPAETTGDVTVTWSPNPEPDLIGYQVYRSYAGAASSAIGSPVSPSSKPTYHDDLTGKAQGQYKYQVQAVRRARTCNTSDDACGRGIASEKSNLSAAVTVRATPATTTTTSTTIKKPSGGGGGTTNTTVKGGGGSTGGGGGTTGTTVKGGTGSTGGGKVAPRNVGGFAPGGSVDLSQFKGLLSGGSTSGGSAGRAPEDEGTYDPTLGYDPSERAVDAGNDDDTLITIGGTSLPAPNDDWVKFIGAGSFMTALLVHVLWFKQQVDAVQLETIIE